MKLFSILFIIITISTIKFISSDLTNEHATEKKIINPFLGFYNVPAAIAFIGNMPGSTSIREPGFEEIFNSLKNNITARIYDFLLLDHGTWCEDLRPSFRNALNKKVTDVRKYLKYTILFNGSASFFDNHLDVFEYNLPFFTAGIYSIPYLVKFIEFLSQINSIYHQVIGYRALVYGIEEKNVREKNRQIMIITTKFIELIQKNKIYKSSTFLHIVDDIKSKLPSNFQYILINEVVISHYPIERKFLNIEEPEFNSARTTEVSFIIGSSFINGSSDFKGARWVFESHNYQNNTFKIRSVKYEKYYLFVENGRVSGGRLVPAKELLFVWQIDSYNDYFELFSLKHMVSNQYLSIDSRLEGPDSDIAVNDDEDELFGDGDNELEYFYRYDIVMRKNISSKDSDGWHISEL